MVADAGVEGAGRFGGEVQATIEAGTIIVARQGFAVGIANDQDRVERRAQIPCEGANLDAPSLGRVERIAILCAGLL